ncbi:medium-chain acyl-CoA ligase ACSF2, mitochondrial-like [Ptychodera flava]|uniref:medium-chain acyl-CoA ligase ACSF2, mitochondrial-like n=1 Tax=Ptychodera flava TaxID=63121 RepID=UPI00396AAC15
MDEDGKQGSLSFQQILTTGYVSEKELQARQRQVCSDNILSLYFTSGSTGFPKCVVHTHHTQINSQRASNTREKCSKARELLASSDLAHIGAIRAILFPGLFGTTSIFLPPKHSIENTMMVLQDECVTRTRLRPNVLFDLINHPHFNEYNLQSLETVFTGGYLVPESIMNMAVSALGCHVVDDYGSTEMIDGLFSEVSGVSSEEMQKYPNCVYPSPGNEIKVVDADGNIVAVNTIGELWVRSPFLFLYYLGDKEATDKVKTSDGWFKSGDLVSMNGDGWCKIVGRLNDMIIREGINIYPSEIEMAVALHPKVSQVQVVAIPDEKVHQRVCICIITKNSQVCTEEEILKFCHGRIHEAHIPDHVFFVKEFPKTFSNKLQWLVQKWRLVSMNEDGWCKIVGRLNDMIIREGINIYPSEIEMAIALHPKVSQVQVVAIPDEKVHQRVCICIITKNSQVCTEEEILEFCHGRIHAAHIPDHVIFVKEFPKTFSNKLDRRQLSQVAEETLFSKK